jgi:NitT/TauT family transport system permease protein
VWLPSGRLPAFVAFLMVLPLTFSNLTQGIAALDRKLLEMAGLFRFSGPRTFRLILLPGLMPHITSACAAGLGFAWKSVIAAEVICHPSLSIGGEIQNARVYLEMTDLFALTAAVIFMSVIIERGAVLLLRRLEKRMLAISTQKGGGNV